MQAPRRRHNLTAAAALLLCATGSAAWAGTRQQRRSSQPDAEEGEAVTLRSTTQATIAALSDVLAPSALPQSNRVLPTGATVHRLVATLTVYELDDGSGYHLVLSDGAGNTLIAESVGRSSPLLSSIERARAEFDAHHAAAGSFQTANVPVTVTGVGFFDFLPGQTGVAPNGIELHAVLEVGFGTGGQAPPDSRLRKRIAVSASSWRG